MAKAPTRRLKVFQAQFGFYDTVVAAPSQAAALRAWGTHQNLFSTGQAQLTDNAQAIAAAQEHPETPLRRPVGTDAPFVLEPTSLPDVPVIARVAPRQPKPGPPRPEPPKPAADRSDLDAAEAALKAVDERRKREEADLRRRLAALEAEMDAAQSAYVAARKDASAAVVAARQAYRKAGGAD